MIRVLSAICILAAVFCFDRTLGAQEQARDAARSVEPAEVKSLIERAEQVLSSKRSDVSAVLSDQKYLPAHGWPRFRELIKRNARVSKVTMVTKEEPGDHMTVRIRFVEEDGSASVGALVYLYHTDARGDYGPNDANVPLVGSDNEYARLFCYALTDSDERIEVDTIRAGGYPDSDDPEHIHLRIITDNGRNFGSAISFDDDPRLNQKAREEAAQDGVVICPVTKDANGHGSIDALIRFD